MRPSLAQPWRRYVQVHKLSTEVYGIDADAATGRRLRIVVVPGNPGNARYYERFMQSLHQKFEGSADIMAFSHLGHDPDTPHKGQVWDLQQQIQHKADFLQQHVLNQGPEPVVVLAHSIGTYMAAHALPRLTSTAASVDGAPVGSAPDKIIKVFGLFPFLAVDKDSKRQGMLKSLAASSGIMGTVAGALSLLPFFAKSFLVGAFSKDMEPHAVDTTVHLLAGSSVRNNFHLAHHEFQDLDKPVDWPLLRGLGRRFTMVACPDDVWFPEHHFTEAKQELPEAELQWREDLTHAFCIYTKECDEVAGLVHESVQPLLLEYESGSRQATAATAHSASPQRSSRL